MWYSLLYFGKRQKVNKYYTDIYYNVKDYLQVGSKKMNTQAYEILPINEQLYKK